MILLDYKIGKLIEDIYRKVYSKLILIVRKLLINLLLIGFNQINK
jgi:hypothetical protein